MSYTVRVYTNDDSFTKLTAIPFWVGEIQVALAFARDYDEDNNPTNGKFKPYWDTEIVTPTVITHFKEAALPLKVKVLVSIGDRSAQYPFRIEAGEKDSWVINATKSLKSIIKEYNLDGIDVYYEHIDSEQHDFVDCIGQLMAHVKKNDTKSVASIAPTAPLNDKFYFPLYKKYNIYVDTVVYQCFTQPKPIKIPVGLAMTLTTIANQFYPKTKLLAGYSTISKDWATVSPPLYFFSVSALLIWGTLAGTSIWVTTSDSVTPPQKILERLSSALNGPGNPPVFSRL